MVAPEGIVAESHRSALLVVGLSQLVWLMTKNVAWHHQQRGLAAGMRTPSAVWLVRGPLPNANLMANVVVARGDAR
jgi:hypothetical protein